MVIQVQFGTPALVRSGDTMYVNFADGSQLEMTGPTGIQDYVAANTPDANAVRAMAIANRLAQDPLLDSPEVWDGKEVTLNLEQSNPSNVFKVSAAADWDAWPFAQNCMLSSRAGGNWTDVDTSRLFIEPILADLAASASSGGMMVPTAVLGTSGLILGA